MTQHNVTQQYPPIRKGRAAALAAVFVFAAVGAGAELKVAVVDSQNAIAQSEEAKSLFEKARKELEGQQSAAQSLQSEFDTLRERLETEGDVMAEAERREVRKEIEDKRIDLEFHARKWQKELQDRQAEIAQIMVPKVQAIVADMVQVERYDLVFERSAVGFVNPRHDITAKVTEKLNERYSDTGKSADGAQAE